MIVVPGGPGFGRQYLEDAITAQLSDIVQLIFYEQRGSGASTGADRPALLTMAQFVADLDAVRAAVGIDRVTLLGHSFGGLLALHYAIAYPDRTDRVVVIDGDPITYAGWATYRDTIATRRSPADAARLDAFTANPDWQRQPELVEAYFRVFLRPYFADPAQAEALNFGFTADSLANLNAAAAALRADLGEWDITGPLQALDVSVLLIYGDCSVFAPTAIRATAAAVPNARLEVLSNVGHFPFIEDPSRFRTLIREFLRSSGN